MSLYFSPSTLGFYDTDLNTSIPVDAVETTSEARDTALAAQSTGLFLLASDEDGQPTSLERPGPLLGQRLGGLLVGVDAHLNAAAKAKGYDSILSAALRAGYPGPFHAEGVAFATWMDATYAECYRLLAEFQAGDIEEPTLEALISMLPEAPGL